MTETTTTTTTTTPTTPVLTEQQKADRLAISLLKNKIKAGTSLLDDEVIFYLIGDSIVAQTVMSSLDAGGGYNELKTIGLTETQTIDVLSVYNVKVAPAKYEAELGVDAIEANKNLLSNFLMYLTTNNIQFPDLNALYTSIRSNPTVYAALRQWNKTRA